MLRYSAFGLTIDSEIPLGEASCSLDGPADVVLRQGQVLNPTNRSGPDNEFVNIRPVGAFHIRNGSEIVAQLNPDVDPELLRVILSGRMMGYLLRQRGWLPLHASAVQMGDYAVLFAADGYGQIDLGGRVSRIRFPRSVGRRQPFEDCRRRLPPPTGESSGTSPGRFGGRLQRIRSGRGVLLRQARLRSRKPATSSKRSR